MNSELLEAIATLLSDTNNVDKFCKEVFDLTGKGTARNVYRLGKIAIKVARNQKGLVQNEAEYKIWREPYSNGIVTDIYYYSSDFSWLLVQYAKPKGNRVLTEGGVIRYIPPSLRKKIAKFKEQANLAEADEFGMVGSKYLLIDYGVTIPIAKKYYARWYKQHVKETR